MSLSPRSRGLVGVAVGAGTVLAGWAVRQTFLIVDVEGWSMAPALRSGDRLLVLRRGIRPRLRSIVLLRPPRRRGVDAKGHPKGEWMVKRIAAVAGDCYPPVVVSAQPELIGTTIPRGTVVVLGDNPLSMDSKQWGAIELENIAGVVIARLRQGALAPPHSPPPVG